ncbi:hexokinase-1 [Drepanopeziza brunnea f. sp. 'multigermtubi' MB_m1]|uniref:Phosphotransferase n=1 Tax=Marssonina brunnea f. sp. multigermtubi (strain MB_m1) TaxID=1072389 RepID=K1WVP8_MARBU|nr:hexokinase-1 [Drepanopeziza brunnea f. sp. 'multigermtubi' MB_m1]EKD21695.1 hexokinase-1 [Drepanopeziza brunnea f. sp. 'multigermtubi' MB_m1]
MTTTRESQSADSFLLPLQVDTSKIRSLARSLHSTFTSLAAESQEQFLPTPISDSILRPEGDENGSGGTNLRVGFIELLGSGDFLHGDQDGEKGEDKQYKISRVKRHLEKSWPIGEQLKNDRAEELFAWIGERIAEVIHDGCLAWPGELPDQLPLGVTFSFPMIQHTLSEATLMPMGKGFKITSNLDLAKLLRDGYEVSRSASLPRIKIAAIVNDAVATLVAFAYMFRKNARHKAVMGLIVGTGCNATIPLPLSKLHPSKRPTKVEIQGEKTKEADLDLKITVNTEWTIKGAAGPLHEHGFITPWDRKLDAEGEMPGFQPFQYMTSGRYLGELGRIIILEFLTDHLSIPESTLPPRLRQRNGLTTSFLGSIGPHLAATEPSMLKQVERELPSSDAPHSWQWTDEGASIVYAVAKAIQIRAAGMIAAAVVALLACAGEIELSTISSSPSNGNEPALPMDGGESELEEMMVGYTGSCIVHFQDYLEDSQWFLDEIMEAEFGNGERVPRVSLRPCHDGGIIGAGILAGTVQSVMAQDA